MQQSNSSTWAFLGGGIGLVISALVFVFWLWMLIDAITKEKDPTMRLIWALVVFFLPCVGSLVYFFVRKMPRNR